MFWRARTLSRAHENVLPSRTEFDNFEAFWRGGQNIQSARAPINVNRRILHEMLHLSDTMTTFISPQSIDVDPFNMHDKFSNFEKVWKKVEFSKKKIANFKWLQKLFLSYEKTKKNCNEFFFLKFICHND